MDSSATLLIIGLILSVAAWIAQRIMIQKIYDKTGKDLRLNKFLSIVVFLAAFLPPAALITGLTGSGPQATSTELLILLACLVVVAILVVRNIKVAGIGMGIALAVVQVLAAFITLFTVIAQLAFGMAGAQLGGGSLGNAGPKSVQQITEENVQAAKAREAQNREEERERQEAYAQKTYGMSAQEAFRAGLRDGINPDLFEQ